jgi:hypothetical protein
VNRRALPLVIEVEEKHSQWWCTNARELLMELETLVEVNAASLFVFDGPSESRRGSQGERTKSVPEKDTSKIIGDRLQFSYSLLKSGEDQVGTHKPVVGTIVPLEQEGGTGGFECLPTLNYTLECSISPRNLA